MILVPTKFVDKFAKEINRSTDKFGFLGHSNTLASRGLEELFFQLCCCVSFWFWREIGFGFTYL